MELRHLKYFVAVAEELHFARAAERLNIAAPTLSHQIGALETMLGAKLLTRKTRSAVALTNAGKRFLIAARDALKQAAYAETVGRHAARGDTGSIAVGYVFSNGCGGLVSSTLAGFRKTHPEVSFQLARMQTFAQFKALINGNLDVAFARALARYPTGLAGFIIERQPFNLVLPENHPLAARTQVTPAMLVDESFIGMTLEMESGFWGNIAAVTPPGLSLRIVERAPDAFTVLALVAAGIGISVLSESLSRINMPGLTFRKLVGVTRTADHAVVYRKNESAPVVKAFIDFLRAEAKRR
ncbi:MAG: LysR family transcriptional regulator [Rhizobiales bacterium]|nr:LysR family transcriptional regulator [Hyphomicrobiales bacterium]